MTTMNAKSDLHAPEVRDERSPGPGAGRFRSVSGLSPAAKSAFGVAGLVGLLVIWELVVVIGKTSPAALPSPVAVLRELVDQRSTLWSNELITLREILIGFGLSLGVGVILAILMAWSPIVEALFYPVLVVSQAVPKIAVAPLFLVWLGFGMATNAVLALLVAVFPVIVNTLLGLTSLDANYIKLGRVMGANSWRLFVRIRLPAALPSIFAGLKVAMTLATIGAIVGELISGQRGLGGVVQTASGQVETTLAFAAVAALSLLGIVLFYAVALAEKIVVRHG